VAIAPAADPSAAPAAADETRLEGTIEAVVYVGALSHYVVDVPSVGRLTAQRTNDRPASDLAVGTQVVVSWPAESAFVLPEGGS
jgi:hypothetical protein